MRFKHFFAEFGSIPVSSYGANARFGFWQLPSMNFQGMNIQNFPQGGFNSLNQLTQWKQNQARFDDPDFLMVRTLEMLSSLAENVVTAVNDINQLRQAGFTPPSHHYLQVTYDYGAGLINGLTMQDMTSGPHPRLHPEDVKRAEDAGVIFLDPKTKNYNISIAQLRSKIDEYRTKIGEKEHGFQVRGHQAAMADKAIGAATSGGMVQLSKSANPMGGG
jgi:hypothetical protein